MLKEPISVVQCADAIGAEITGVDLAGELTEGIFRSIAEAWHDHGVLVFRNQQLTKQKLVAFSALFGTPVKADHQERELSSSQAWPEVMIVSNVVEKGRAIGHLGSKEAQWHTDMCYTDTPPIASVLYAREVPPTGGDTGFMDMYKVYNRLPQGLKSTIADLRIKHDRSYTAVGELRHGYGLVDDVSRSPGAVHPVLRPHQITGSNCLYLGRRLNSYVMGLSVAESEELLNELWEYTRSEDLTWHHQWEVGDVTIWDNRRLMHRRDAFDPNCRRLMWRTQIEYDGTRPC